MHADQMLKARVRTIPQATVAHFPKRLAATFQTKGPAASPATAAEICETIRCHLSIVDKKEQSPR